MNGYRTAPGVEVVLKDLNIPWALAFSPQGDLYFTEREGKVNKYKNGKINTLLVLNVEARPGDEGGLLGLAFSPNYRIDKQVYVYYTYKLKGVVTNRVSRFTENESILVDEKIVIDNIPGGRVHNGGRIKFGPDGKLYVTTGETWRRYLAQDLKSLGGKILRVNPDGSVPEDNPFEGSLVYSLGNRNPQGLAWYRDGTLFSSEHGPSGENGWYAHDEINVITPGGNYGWPYVLGKGNTESYIDPIIETGEDTWAPSGIEFYTGEKYTEWKNNLFIANLRGQHLRVVKFTKNVAWKVESSFPVLEGSLGRLRDVVQGPDGYLYLCTNNRDGRGNSVEGDDLILRITNPSELFN